MQKIYIMIVMIQKLLFNARLFGIAKISFIYTCFESVVSEKYNLLGKVIEANNEVRDSKALRHMSTCHDAP